MKTKRAGTKGYAARIAGAAAALMLAASLGACGGGDDDDGGGSSAQTSKTVELKVAVINDLTGPLSFYGIEQMNSAKLAAELYNADHPDVKVTVTGYDSKSSPAGAIAALRKAQAAGPDAIAGFGFSQSAEAAMPLLRSSQAPVVFNSITEWPKGEHEPNWFTVSNSYVPLMEQLVDNVLVPKEVKRLAVIWQQNPNIILMSKGIEARAKEKGIAVVSSQGASLTATDFNAQVTNALSKKPDAVAVLGIGGPTGTMTAQLRQRGFKGTIVGQAGAAGEQMTKVAGKAADGFVYSAYFDAAEPSGAAAQEYLKAYAEKYPKQPTPALGSLGYAGVEILAEAAAKARSTDSEALTKALDTGTFDTVLNPALKFTDGKASLIGVLIEYDAAGTARPYASS